MSSVITLGDNCWVLSLSKELASLESMSRIIYGIPKMGDKNHICQYNVYAIHKLKQ